MMSPTEILLRHGSIFDVPADLIIIPCSTTGTVSDNISDYLEDNDFPMPPEKMEIGEVQFFNINDDFGIIPYKFVAYTASVNSGESTSPSTVNSIFRYIISFIESSDFKINKISCPLLGSGAGRISPHVSLTEIYKIFLEYLEGKNCKLIISIFEDNIFDTIKSILPTLRLKNLALASEEKVIKTKITTTKAKAKPKSRPNPNITQESASASFSNSKKIIDTVVNAINEIIKSPKIQTYVTTNEFYFQKGRQAFIRFQQIHDTIPLTGSTSSRVPGGVITTILNSFLISGRSFSDYWKQLEITSFEYKLFEAIATCVAYFDKRAYKINELNKYSPIRYIASSGIRQNDWASNLLKYKISGLDNLSSSGVKNAIKYIEGPSKNLSMLSENHRKMVSETILSKEYDSATFTDSVFKFFDQFKMKVTNEDNRGILYSAILYDESIKTFWLDKDTGIPPEEETSELFNTQTKLHSDQWAEIDLLDYELYAEAITEIIKKEESKPPLNIAIIAPWGQGKTTLMKFIEKNFNLPSATEAIPAVKSTIYIKAKTFLKKINNKLFKNNKVDNTDPIADSYNTTFNKFISLLKKHINIDTKLVYPTVWFNPWKYNSSEQIWSGLAHSIITQLVKKLTPAQQEVFWLKLRYRRIDSHAIRKDIHKALFEKWIVKIILLIVSVISSYYLVIHQINYSVSNFAWWTTVPLIPVSIMWGVYDHLSFLNKPLEGKFSEYVKEPQYHTKLGVYHEVTEDLQKVFSILIDKPAIIFIDDLDRCSPKVVAEVFEAINLMMNSDFAKDCYFIIGMDSEMVSASLDVAYHNLKGKLIDKEKTHGSVGWYFLDKFIQLSFTIPIMKKEKKIVYLSNLFHTNETQQTDTITTAPVSVQEIENDVAKVYNATSEKASKNIIEKYSEKQKTEFEKAFIREGVKKFSFDNPKIQAELKQYAPYLSSSPRVIKRFANVLRFYHSQQQLRKQKAQLDESIVYASTDALAKWLIIQMRWPQFFRWVQTDHDFKGESLDSITKAKRIDGIIAAIKKENEDLDTSYQTWINEFTNQKDNTCISCIENKELFMLIMENSTEDNTIEKAFLCNVW